MNIEKVSVGMQFKNYIEFCNYLGEMPKRGRSRVFQEKNLKRYFEYHKEGQKIIIDEVNDTVDPNFNVYFMIHDLLVLNKLKELSMKDGKQVHFIKDQFTWEMIQNFTPVSDRYGYFKLNKYEFRKNTILLNVFDCIEGSLKGKVTRIFKSLQSQNLLNVMKFNQFITIDDQYLSERLYFDVDNLYLDAKREALVKLGYERVESITDKTKYYEISTKILNKLLKKNNILDLNGKPIVIKCIYSVWRINHVNINLLDNQIEKLNQEIAQELQNQYEVEKLYKLLSIYYNTKHRQNAQNRVNKQIKKYGLDKPCFGQRLTINEIELKPNYIYNAIQIIDAIFSTD